MTHFTDVLFSINLDDLKLCYRAEDMKDVKLPSEFHDQLSVIEYQMIDHQLTKK